MGLKGNGAIFTTFSDGGRHRLRLWRDTGQLASSGVVPFVMLNPSTADADVDDPTIRRCIDFAIRWNYSQLQVVNLFTFRTPKPRDLKKAHAAGEELVALGGNSHIKKAIREADMVVAAWGQRPAFARSRAHEVLAMCDRWHVLGYTKEGHPRHPLFMKKTAQLVSWDRGING